VLSTGGGRARAVAAGRRLGPAGSEVTVAADGTVVTVRGSAVVRLPAGITLLVHATSSADRELPP